MRWPEGWNAGQADVFSYRRCVISADATTTDATTPENSNGLRSRLDMARPKAVSRILSGDMSIAGMKTNRASPSSLATSFAWEGKV